MNTYYLKAIRILNPELVINGAGDTIEVVSGEMPSDADINTKIAELEAEVPMEFLREQRNSKLTVTDWWATTDRIMTDEQESYRKALRDLPSTASPELDSDGNLTNVTWPSKPE